LTRRTLTKQSQQSEHDRDDRINFVESLNSSGLR